MRRGLLYTAVLLAANAVVGAALAGPVDWDAARAGGLAKIVPAEPPQPLPEVTLTARDGALHKLDELRGKVVVLNFWATWCAPCREEMPSLQDLSKSLDPEQATVIAVAAGRNPPAAIDRFVAEAGIDALTIWLDPRQEAARALGIMGLPVTVILDREGREIARLTGDADWSGQAARDVVAQALAP